MTDISELPIFQKEDKIRSFHHAMEAIFPDYTREQSYCTWKLTSNNKDSTTFGEVRNNTEHPLYPCTICEDYEIDSGCKNYSSIIQTKLYDVKVTKDRNWRLDTK